MRKVTAFGYFSKKNGALLSLFALDVLFFLIGFTWPASRPVVAVFTMVMTSLLIALCVSITLGVFKNG